jgi:serine protease AprX
VDGTSFAAPIVTSVVAQMIEANPHLTPTVIKDILIATADRVPGLPLMNQGYGVMNARRAVEQAGREQHTFGPTVFSPPQVEAHRLVFQYHDDLAREVALVGDFNDWDLTRTPFARERNGLWRAEIEPPPPGRYCYKFVINGQRWIDDPSNGFKEPDGYSGLNSVLSVTA